VCKYSNADRTSYGTTGKFVTGTETGLLIAFLARAAWAKQGSALNCYENFAKFQEQALFGP